MRLFGMLLLSGGLWAMGACGAWRLKRRVRELRELIAGLEAVKRELKYSLAPLPELFRQAAEQTAGEVALLFGCCADRTESTDGERFCYVWKQALSERRLCLDRMDLTMLEQLGGVLGRYDADEQLKALEYTVARLEKQYERAREQSTRLGKVYMILGLTAGIFTLIIFM